MTTFKDYMLKIQVFIISCWIVFALWYFTLRFPVIHAGEVILHGLMLLILLIVFMAIGKRVLRLTSLAYSSFLEECCLAFGVGTGVIIGLIFTLAVIGLLYKSLIVACILLTGILVYKEARALCITGYTHLTNWPLREKSLEEIVFLLFMGLVGIYTFLAAATPPYFYDALAYHLAVPEKYLFHHGFRYFPYHGSSNFPANLGMLFLVGLSFAQDGILAKLLSWLFTPMTVLAVYGFARRHWGSQLAITAAAITFLTPGILITSTLTAVDCAVMFYAFLSFWMLFSWFSSRQNVHFWLAGVFCSLAVGAKYPAIVTACFPLVLLLFLHEKWVQKQSWLASVKRAIGLGLLVGSGVSPWFIKNLLYTGNPVYPFFNALFGSQASAIVDYSQYKLQANSLFEGYAPQHWLEIAWLYLKTPWIVTMTTTGIAGKTGVLFLLCLPCVILLKKLDAAARSLLIFAGFCYWLWVFLLPGTLRYAFPMLPPLSLATAYILWHLPISSFGRKLILQGVCVILGYHLIFLFGATNVTRPLAYLFGNLTKEEFLAQRGVGYYSVAQYVNQELPQEVRILFVGENRGFYCERDYVSYNIMTVIDDHEIILRKLIVASQSLEEVLQKLHDMGITHFLVNLGEIKRLRGLPVTLEEHLKLETPRDHEIFRQLFSAQRLRLLISEHQVSLYQLLN